jgi:hypothetical protein
MKPVIAILAVAALMLAGCQGKPKPETSRTINLPTESGKTGQILQGDKNGDPKWVYPAPSHEAQVYAELWRVCKERHLTYHVFCYPDLGCNAAAYSNPRDKSSWAAHSEPSGGIDPTKAAEELLKALTAPPNYVRTPYKHPEANFDTGEIRP